MFQQHSPGVGAEKTDVTREEECNVCNRLPVGRGKKGKDMQGKSKDSHVHKGC